ncbi:MAG TPA: (2Fe-2S)-binding protein [Holophaga sp.]|nr:(2Fe-2S)-binding protein [Holophaga sp.]
MDDEPLSEKHARILLKYRPVCICNGIRYTRVADVIAGGAASVEEVARETGCTTGSCHGERCVPVILEMLGGKR